jgi:uncharacterized protein
MDIALADLLARTDLALTQFIVLSRALIPIWLIALVVTGSLTWLGRSWTSDVMARSRPDDGRRHRTLEMPVGALLGMVSPFPLLSVTPTVGLLLQSQRSRSFAIGLALGSVVMSPATLTFGLAAMGIRLVILQVVMGMAIACGAGMLLARMRPVHVLRAASWPSCAEPKRSEKQALVPYLLWLARHLAAMAPHFVLALLVVAWLMVLFPGNAVVRMIGHLGPLTIPAAAFLGAGMHQCPSTIPVAAELFAQAGLPGGALLAYITFGQATTIRNLVGLHHLLKSQGILVFLIVALFITVLLAFLASI